MLKFIQGEALHYFRGTYPKGIFKAVYVRNLSPIRAEILVEDKTGTLVKRIVFTDTLERPRPERDLKTQ